MRTKIINKLPEGAVLFLGEGHVQLALFKQVRYHWCPNCACWYLGDPVVSQEYETGNLCGRRGRAYSCCCGHELGFDGCYF
jgi:hypothetical protein